jgi:E3 ubiquitin-protein ligase CHFR
MEGYEENLTCGICHEILYRCVCLIPCLHNFCASCYSEWYERSTQCPSCRDQVTNIRINHAINNLVQTYLKVNPNKQRDAEELKEMDEKSKAFEEKVF